MYKRQIIRCALNQAIRWEYIDTNKRNPASLATLPKVPKVKRKVWSVDTFREAIQQSDDDLLTICMHLAFSCSMRIGEITGLTWEDVIIDEQSIATVSYTHLDVYKRQVRALLYHKFCVDNQPVS